MDLSCLLFSMRPRRAAPFLIPTIALYSKQLLLYNSRPLGTHLKSTLLQVFILRNLKPFGINTYEKLGRGYRLWLTKCSKVVSSSILRTHFQVPYPATPLFATLTKTPGVWGVFFPNWNRSHGPKPARLSVLSSILLPALQPRKRAGNDRAHP